MTTENLTRLKNADELEAMKNAALPKLAIRKDPSAPIYGGITHHVMVCCDTGCTATGARKIVEAFENDLKAKGLDKTVDVVVIGCHGFCEMGPLIVVYPN
ncbi:MAG: (2Fe-2S) ferredoxin domain-containing protein, partial [Deltaproteobacteria bacterium]|nr:(2Fe-2S) ferredoxin domain-containing protein [Deltaproteobacteria bacterium]